MALKDFQIVFLKMSNFFKTPLEQGFALVYIDDILLLSNSKEHMFQLIEQLHIISTKTILNSLMDNPLSCFSKLIFLDMELGTIQLNPYINPYID